MVFVNYYEVLEVSGTATEQEITSAYRKLALKYHPDKSGSEGVERFLLVHKAYKVLCEPLLRKNHDEKIQLLESINVKMKMTDERVWLYERLYKKNTPQEFEKMTKRPLSKNIFEDAAPKPHPRKQQEFEEFERFILERMRAG